MTPADAAQRICPFASTGNTRFHCMAQACMMWDGDLSDGDCSLATRHGPKRPAPPKLPAATEAQLESAGWPSPIAPSSLAQP
jgi:hypothetical protein